MKMLIPICFLMCLISCAIAQAPAETVLRTYEWKDLMSQHPLPNSEIVSMDGMSVLKVECTNNAPLEIPFLTMTNSSVIKKADFISWEMKYENIGEAITNWDRTGNSPIEYSSGQLALLIHRWPLAI